MESHSWTTKDTFKLLQWIAAHNGREPGKSDVIVWTAAAQTGRWVPDLANEAVTSFHLRNSDRLISPADVHNYVRSKIEDRAMRLELEEVKKARPVAELVAADAAKRAIPTGPDPLCEIPAPCAHCHAADGESCTVRTSKGLRAIRPHETRHGDLREAAVQAGLRANSESTEKCPTCAAPARSRCVNIVTGRYRSRGDHGERDGHDG